MKIILFKFLGCIVYGGLLFLILVVFFIFLSRLQSIWWAFPFFVSAHGYSAIILQMCLYYSWMEEVHIQNIFSTVYP